MGCGNSAAFDAFAEKPEFPALMRQFQAMQFTKSEVKRLFEIFHAADVDGSGSIALAELLVHIDMERTPFTEKIFSIFDDDKSGEIDFKEFVLSLWNYCTLTKNTLDMFAFDLYDKDSSGELSGNEVARMLQDIYGKNEAKRNINAVNVGKDLKTIESSGKLLNLREFTDFVKSRQALLFPAFQMQSALRRKILGEKFWEDHANKRIRFTNGKYISVGQFIVAHTDAEKISPVTQLGAAKNKVILHVHDEVHDLVEVAGTRAARRKSVAAKQLRSSFADTSQAHSDYVLALHGSTPLPSGSGKGSSKGSSKGSFSAQLSSMFRGSSTLPASAAPSSKVHPAHADSSLGTATNLSHGDSIVSAQGAPSGRQGPNANLNAGAVSDFTSPFVSPRDGQRDPGKREAKRRGSKDGIDVPNGNLINPKLTVGAVGKIEQFSAIEAWHKQPAGPGAGGAGAGRDYAVVEAFDAHDPHEPADAGKRRRSVTNALNVVTAVAKTGEGARAGVSKRRGSVS